MGMRDLVIFMIGFGLGALIVGTILICSVCN